MVDDDNGWSKKSSTMEILHSDINKCSWTSWLKGVTHNGVKFQSRSLQCSKDLNCSCQHILMAVKTVIKHLRENNKDISNYLPAVLDDIKSEDSDKFWQYFSISICSSWTPVDSTAFHQNPLEYTYMWIFSFLSTIFHVIPDHFSWL